MKKTALAFLILGTVLFFFSGAVYADACGAAFDYSGACGRNCMMANPGCGLRGCAALCSGGAVGQRAAVVSANANNVVVQQDTADTVVVSDNTVNRAGLANRAGAVNRAGDVNRPGGVNRVGDVNRAGAVDRPGGVNRTTTVNRADGVNRTGSANRSAGNRNGGVNRAGARR